MRPRAARLLLLAALLGGLALAQSTPPPGTPLTLEEALSQLPTAPQWQQADLTVAQAQRALESAQAATGLALSAGGGLSSSTVNGNTTLTPSLSLTASAGLLPWTPQQDAIRAAQRNLQNALAQRAATRNTLALTLEQQYFAARLSQLALSAAQQTVALREQQLAAAQAQRQLGAASQAAVLTATANLQTAQAALANAQQTAQQNLFALGNTLGVNLPDTAFSSAPADPGDPGDLGALIARAQANRSEVLAARQGVAAAQDQLNIARRSRSLPDVSASLRYGQAGAGGAGSSTLSASLDFKSGVGSASFAPPLNGSSGTSALSLGVSASFAILDPAGDAAIRSAETSLGSAQLALTLAQRQVELNVRQQYASLLGARGAIAAATTQLQTAQTTLASVQAQFAAGSVTGTDVLSAQVNLLTAEQNLESALETAQLAAFALQTAQGLGPSLPTSTGVKP